MFFDLALGLVVGSLGTLIGVGGGFVLIPVFLLIFHFTPQHAVGTSLAVVFFNALSGSIAYMRQKKVYYDAAIRFSIATVPGAFLGSYAVRYFTGETFHVVFGLLLVAIAGLLCWRASSRPCENAASCCTAFSYNRSLGVAASVVIGFLSSVLGIGGGIIHVPIMVCLLGFPTHTATATSHFVLAISTFFGVASHYFLGNILIQPAILIGLGSVVGAQIGAHFSNKIDSRKISLLLVIALFLVGFRLMFTANF